MRQQGREQFVRLRAMVGARGFEQGDGLGDRAALGERVGVEDALSFDRLSPFDSARDDRACFDRLSTNGSWGGDDAIPRSP
ncbi:hypothetical protein [Rhodoferax koreensis]|uniref:hypothetical protein n=1 Tax=Rhodoferax koreensis TaxID=1842727 RepID=UPI001EF7458D|nr:hypothetical protein [Rhodoferax koreense]